MSRYVVEMKPAPTMGQHNEYVIKGILGMPDAEYDQLVKEGVID
jgi:crotonobetainyl-CoA:carnitine CoA-transferase CaiB-like acyl-CoA transferase